MNYNKWSNDELIKLRKNVNILMIDDLVKLFPNRNKEQIIEKCKREGLTYIRKNNCWSQQDIQLLKDNDFKTIQELLLIFNNKNDGSIRYNAKKLGVTIVDGQNKWSKKEDEILRNNANGKSTFEEIHELFLPHRSIKAIQSRFGVLGLQISDPNYQAICRTKEYRKNHSKENRYKNKYGIILDKKLMINTYDIIQWWEWTYYGTPNGNKLTCIPIELSIKDNLIKLSKYVITKVIGYKTREDILQLNIKTLLKYKINFQDIYNDSVINCINILFPEFNIKPFELKNVPLKYWQDINNCDEYMEYVLYNDFNVDKMNNIKTDLPPFFTYSTIRALGYSKLACCIINNKQYSSFYEWLNKLHPEWMLTPDDFNEYISFDGKRLNSNEEVLVYNILKKDMKLNIIPVGLRKSKYKFYNKFDNEHYIPDFIINYNNNIIIVEYFGLFRENYGESKILKKYYYKTLRKIDFYNNENYNFISIFPNQIKDFNILKDYIFNCLKEVK